jgi:hypothetical protein
LKPIEIVSPEIQNLATLADLNIEFVTIDSRAAIQFKEKQKQ